MKHQIIAAAFLISSAASVAAFPAVNGANDGIWSSPIIAVLTDAEMQRCNTLKADFARQESEIDGLTEEMGDLQDGDKAEAEKALDELRSGAERIDGERVVLNCPAG